MYSCQFHQHFTRSFYTRRSLKPKKTDSLTVFFALLDLFWNWPQVSISPTFYDQLFLTKVIWKLFLLTAWLCNYFLHEYWQKTYPSNVGENDFRKREREKKWDGKMNVSQICSSHTLKTIKSGKEFSEKNNSLKLLEFFITINFEYKLCWNVLFDSFSFLSGQR